MKKTISITLLSFLLLFLCQPFFDSSKAQNVLETPRGAPLFNRRDQSTDAVFSRLIDAAGEKGAARVIIGLNTNFVPEGRLLDSQVQKQRSAIRDAQADLLAKLSFNRVTSVKQFEYIPYLAAEVDAAALRQMQADSALVNSIQEDEIAEPGLAESTPIVGANAAWSAGYTGSGQTVAILDSGVDKNHTFLAGKVVSEACYSSNTASSVSVCPGGVTESTASNSGLNCDVSINGCAHGTNVAGIAAGKGTSFSGVAKDANIIAIQMFSRFDSASSCGGPAPCALYWTSDLLKALERVRTLATTMSNIVAVNLSLQTGQQFTSNCDTAHAATKAAIDNLRSVNIATIVCAGNFSFTNALTAPACISTAISVGSTDDGSLGTTPDVVSNFSDSSPLLHLLAPGRWINSSIPGNQFQNYTGTSMATPHVVGAFAILKQRKPNAGIDRMLNALITTGQPITDTRNGIVKPRIRIANALAAIVRNSPFDYDGDGKADLSVFRPSAGSWYISQSSNNAFIATQFGANGDLIAPADFDGDGKTDINVFRPADGGWYRLNSSNNTFSALQFGAAGDLPAPGDFDGDGRADITVYRPSAGSWYRVNSSNNQFIAAQFGVAEDKPLVGDFDGDGKSDLAVFRPSNGTWYRINSATNTFSPNQFGAPGDLPVAADYDGDGKTDLAVYRPSVGDWYIINSSNSSFTGLHFGVTEDKPAPADFDGDGKADLVVFRPSSGTWYLLRTTAGFTGFQFGASGDVPTPNAFVR